eukprot:TRINITY_DN8205_c0_g4_i1.p1 TRINITY_DN8205_c0_g4~~TRINITY_DN8205_c0_g4_i1.p1  ORF type:complete len:916 (+),score=124.43 TRINITY_DN8205_c0_g4_i1:246-2750(+)
MVASLLGFGEAFLVPSAARYSEEGGSQHVVAVHGVGTMPESRHHQRFWQQESVRFAADEKVSRRNVDSNDTAVSPVPLQNFSQSDPTSAVALIDQGTSASGSLICTLDGNVQIYQGDHMTLKAGWAKPGHVSAGKLHELGFGPLPNRSAYTAKAVHAELVLMVGMLQDLATRLNTTYWLTGGALIGALRSRTLIPWDEDIDFCLASRLPSHVFDSAYQTQEHALWPGVYGKFIDDVNPAWKGYMVVYSTGGSEVYLFSLLTGLKAEMVYDAWHCDRWDVAMPVLSLPVEGAYVSIPARPLSWLRYADRYGCKNFQVAGAVRMDPAMWTSCLSCTATAAAKVLEGSDKKTSGNTIRSFVFDFVGIGVVVFKGRGLPVTATSSFAGCEPFQGNEVAVRTSIGSESTFLCPALLSVKESAILACLGALLLMLVLLWSCHGRRGDILRAFLAWPIIVCGTIDCLMLRFVWLNFGELPFSVLCAVAGIEMGKLGIAVALFLVKFGFQKIITSINSQSADVDGGDDHVCGDRFSSDDVPASALAPTPLPLQAGVCEGYGGDIARDYGVLVVRFVLPAGCTVFANFLQFIVLTHADLTDSAVVFQLHVFIFGALFAPLVGKNLSNSRFFASFGVLIAVGLYIISESTSPPPEGAEPWDYRRVQYPLLAAILAALSLLLAENNRMHGGEPSSGLEQVVVASIGVCISVGLVAALQPAKLMQRDHFMEGIGLLEVQWLMIVRFGCSVVTTFVVPHLAPSVTAVASLMSRLFAVVLGPIVIAENIAGSSAPALVFVCISSIIFWMDPPTSQKLPRKEGPNDIVEALYSHIALQKPRPKTQQLDG